MFVPKRMFLTKGVGKHREKLTSFELALRSAGIAACNLVRVSSIYGTDVGKLRRERFADGARAYQTAVDLLVADDDGAERWFRTDGRVEHWPEVSTWADGFGVWHARVPLVPRGAARPEVRALHAIASEITSRDEAGPGHQVEVLLVEEGQFTAVYRER